MNVVCSECGEEFELNSQTLLDVRVKVPGFQRLISVCISCPVCDHHTVAYYRDAKLAQLGQRVERSLSLYKKNPTEKNQRKWQRLKTEYQMVFDVLQTAVKREMAIL